jgi:hypothetical protein
MNNPQAREILSWVAARDTLMVGPLRDPVVETLGHPADSPYAERFWLPLIGPSALWALRRLAAAAAVCPDGVPVVLGAFARELGLGAGTGTHAPVVRTLTRLVLFRAADPDGDVLRVRLALPPLTLRQIGRLPDHLEAQLHGQAAREGAA